MSRGGFANSGLGGPSRNYGSVTNNDPEVGFSPTELYNLSENITTNVYTINNSWRTLERALKCIGTVKDNQGLRDKVHVTQLSANQIVAVTSKDLKRLTVVVRRGDKQQKLQVEKLTEDFKEAVARYSDVQKQVADRMKANLLLVNIEDGSTQDNQEENEEHARALQQKQMENKELKFEQEMLLEREQRVKQIEDDVLDVQQIMRELGALIYQQGETIDTIENGIEHATDNVELGASELLKAAEYQRKSRRRMCMLLSIAMIIFTILLWILISSFRSGS